MKKYVFIGAAFLVIIALCIFSFFLRTQYTSKNLKIAFIGDQGLGSNAEAVLQLIADEGADAVVHQGDLDYEDDPQAWDDQVNKILGPDFPYFVSAGHHDEKHWEEGYLPFITERLKRIQKKHPKTICTGELGKKASCYFKGLFVVFTAPGIFGDGDKDYAPYIKNQLAKNDSIWRVCSWAYNQREMQIGGKPSQVGWGAYEACRQGGAIIATGHEHSYQRTKTLINTEQQIIDPQWPSHDLLRVAKGATFAFVSGLGGHSVRIQKQCFPTQFPYGCKGEWAKVYTKDQEAKFGALFIEFHVDGDPYKARGYFKNIEGEIVDEFEIVNQINNDQDRLLCGNGNTDDQEQCDDGNNVSGDGCSSSCFIEQQKTCLQGECIPKKYCGDNKVTAPEQCDDGNRLDGDGCSSECLPETKGLCGDNTRNIGEQCDDGNTKGLDGCSQNCHREYVSLIEHAVFNGVDKTLTLGDHPAWDFTGNLRGFWSVDFWIQHASVNSDQMYLQHYENEDNRWALLHHAKGGLRNFLLKDGEIVFDSGAKDEIRDNELHHIALIRVGPYIGIYRDGIQVAYMKADQPHAFNGNLYIGSGNGKRHFLTGSITQVRIHYGDYFGARPNKKLSDRINPGELNNGIYKEYHKNGALKLVSYWEEGKKQGPFIYYDAQQRIILEEYFENGLLDDVVKEYYSNGILKSETVYMYGNLQGFSKKYSAQGDLLLHLNYKNNMLNGIQSRYYANGSLMEEISYKDNKFHGPFKRYTSDGQLLSYANYKDFTLDGIQREYHVNGKVKVEISMKKGRLHGVVRLYDLNGSILKEEKYFAGIKIK